MNNLLKKRFGLMISHSFFLLVSLSLLVDCSNANDTEKNLKTKLKHLESGLIDFEEMDSCHS